MSEPDSPTRGELHHHHEQQQLHQSSSQYNTADERDDANNSIIGKVKSRVSSIFPQKLTQWFSPSTAANTTSNGGLGRRRRRNDQSNEGEYERANNSDNESNNSAEDEPDASPASTRPPSKRSRLNVEVTTTNFKESQSLVSSTPTIVPRRRLTHLNLYGKQKEPAYNFVQTTTTTNTRSTATTKNSSVDSADITEVVPDRNLLNTSISSRRSLNIPSSTLSSDAYRNLHDLKRQSVSSLRAPGAGSSMYSTQRTSTKLLHIQDGDDDEEEEQKPIGQTIVVEEEDDEIDEEDDNEESEEIAKVTSKKQKFTNGNLMGRPSSVATESGESRSSSVAQIAPKSGLFNPANRGLRTLSGNGLNFYSHLEGRKSLFSEKNMPGMLNNSTLSLTSLNRRQFNSSIYGSTSALSDSRLLNTSSPFYKGQTTYGGAAAYSKFNRTLNQSVRIAPTLIRPTSSLSTLSSSTNSLAQGNDQSNSTISSTAKRILELINDFSTPLNDAKKMASNIKTPAMLANRAATGKRFSEVDLATSRSVRLSSVRSPYTRPSVTLNPNPNDSKKALPSLKELQVPSMSQLLQMKKMQNCTERSRHIANTSKSVLNQESEYKLPGATIKESGEDKSTASKHVSKIKNKVTASSRLSSKNAVPEDEEAPAPANLPNIAFPFMQSVPKIDISVKSTIEKPTASSESKVTKPTNNFSFGVAASKPAMVVEKSTPAPSKPAVNFSFGTANAASTPIASSNEFKFSSPVSVSYTPTKGELAPINNFKFSSPLMVGGVQNAVEKPKSTSTAVPNTVPQLKTGSVLDALKKSTTSTAATKSPTTTVVSPGASLFGGQFKKLTNEWECPVCMIRNKETVEKCVACTTPRSKPAAAVGTSNLPPLSNSLAKNSFGDAFKPRTDTWECDACMVRNKSDANECVACNTKKPGASGVAPSAPKLQTTDVGFKSLVAKQTASKWECDACMTRNDAERNKCVCCEQAKPGSQVVSDDVPKFSFGTSSASKFTFGFAGAKKEEELKAEAATKTENNTGFTFGMPAAKVDAVSSTGGIMFGMTQPVAKPTSSAADTGKDVPDVAKTNAIGFKFGFQPADSSKTPTASTAPAGFSFGAKSDASKPSSVKFNLPPTTESKQPATTASNSAITSTSSSTSSPSSSSSSSLQLNPIATSAFGAPQKPNETKSTPVDVNKATGFVFGATAASTKPITFGNAVSSESKITFGNPSTTPATSSVSTSTPGSGGFVFGKPAAVTAPASTNFAGTAFGKSADSSITFGSPASSSTNAVVSKSSITFGSTSTAVSSSTTGFAFGKPAATTTTTTPMFGAAATAPATSSTATSSVFGSMSSSLFTGGSSVPTSIISSTLSTKPTVAAPASTAASSSTAFVFGSPASTSNATSSNKPLFGFESSSNAAKTTASSWPTNTFSFGSSKPPEEVKTIAAAPAPSFGAPASIFGQTASTSIFGPSNAQVGEVKPTPAAAPSFGAVPSATTSLFGSNAAALPAVQQPSSNVFGSTSSTPVFGSMSFGAAPASTGVSPAATNTNSLSTATPTFGFGSIAAASSSNSDGASAPKKSEPAPAFNFGSSQSSGNSGFSFGSNNNNNNNNNKPAADSVFKFSTSSAPTFNFTGSTEGSSTGGPFQFNAAAPSAAASNNIFAPTPTPGSQAVSQQARRKMRTTIRRITPR